MKTTKFLAAFLFAAALTASSSVFAQVKIGNNPGTINSSAVLDVESTNKGFLPPRVGLQSKNDGVTIANPATGLLVYNTNASSIDGVGIYINSGTPASPLWGKLEAITDERGGTAVKLSYRGTTDPSRVITAGNLQFRYRIEGINAFVEGRLVSQPTETIYVKGQRLGWYAIPGNNTVPPGTQAIYPFWTTSDWDQWKIVDYMWTNTSHIYYLDVTGDSKFYRVNASIRFNEFNSILVETF